MKFFIHARSPWTRGADLRDKLGIVLCPVRKVLSRRTNREWFGSVSGERLGDQVFEIVLEGQVRLGGGVVFERGSSPILAIRFSGGRALQARLNSPRD